MLAYENIKSKPGNMTPGILPETLDGMSIQAVDSIVEKLKDESFQFRTARRVSIPKASGGTRSLTIAPPRDKIVQEALRLILNAIYEPLFMEQSHGFRPNRGTHSALKYINQKFQSTVWMIEGDIEKCFDSINHHKLMEIIENKIQDRKFTRILWKSLRAHHMETHTIKHNIIGTFQGSILSPLLANIFLHQLDEFILREKSTFDRGTVSRVTPEYNRLKYAEHKLRAQGHLLEAQSIARSRRTTTYSNYQDENYKRLSYVRYADDWLVGIKGTRQETVALRDKIKDFLENIGLKLSESKTKITNLNHNKNKVLFLGTHINRAKHTKYVHINMNGNNILKRNPKRLRFQVPMTRIEAKLTEAGFIKGGKSHPKFVWMHMTHEQILNRYNAVLKGMLNYYSFAHNYGKFAATLEYILKGSCAKLLAAKYSLKTQLKVMNKYGRNLQDPQSGKGFDKITYNIKLKFNTNFNPTGVIPALYSYKSSATLENKTCAVCESTERVEMHHVRALKDLKLNKSWVDKLMAKAKRKQIPLCQKCHINKHNHVV